jgi:hypothetical protein
MPASVRIGITAPDAATAFALDERLSHLRPAVLGSADAWQVELEDDQSRLEEIVAVVRHWLRDMKLDWTELSVGGVVERIDRVERTPAKLGSGYDEGPVLTHEP